MTTRVLVDGRALYDGNRHRGVGTYLWHLLEELGRTGGVEPMALVVKGTEVPPGVEAHLVKRSMPARLAGLEHALRLPAEIARVAPDVFHSPSLDVPRRTAQPWVQTLLDVIPMVHPDPMFAGDRRRWRRRARRINEAARVIAVSEYSAAEGARVLGIDRTRLRVAPLGVDSRFTPVPDPAPQAVPYLLYVGVYGRHKGYPEAFAVISELAGRGYPHRLRVVGRLDTWIGLELDRELTLCRSPGRVDLLGSVGAAQLLDLYRGATALIVSSRHEGFGLPALEAMATGTPVVAFRNSSTAEVVEGGGELVADGDVTAMADAVAAIIDDPARAAELAESGMRRAAGFTWSRCAQLHAQAFAEATS